MGAINFEVDQRGTSMSDAYSTACEEAIAENGIQDGYNGTISTTSGFKDVTNEFKNSKLDLDDFIEKNEHRAEKWGDCLAIQLEKVIKNTNKIKSIVKHIVFKGARKWETRYVVYSGFHSRAENMGYSTKKGEAVKTARAHTEKTQENTFIRIEKVLMSGNSTVAEISYKKSGKQKGKPTTGKYVFFGRGAC